ncbi:MAG TPA: hypothetical protein ENI73_08095 [Spirochaetes bacterium]|nr:hypothetical protein [Spirochaetota bacterium]
MIHKNLSTKSYFILFTMLIFIFCGTKASSKKLDESYFPKNKIGEFRAKWYSKHLRKANEPILYTLTNKKTEIYRFTWLRTFHHPIMIRVYQSGGKSFLIAKELSGAGGYDPGELKHNVKRQLLKKEWQNILEHVKKSSYWYLKTKIDDLLGFDGAKWIMEGVKKGKYHVVDRWSPEKGSYRELCLYLLKLSGLKVKRIY